MEIVNTVSVTGQIQIIPTFIAAMKIRGVTDTTRNICTVAKILKKRKIDMREIIFRGKRKDNDEWVEGYYARKGVDKDTFKHFICVMTFNVNGNTYSSMFYLTDIEVIPETVGQYTGLCDKNGTKIFENGYMIIDNKTYKVIFDNAEYILTNIFNCDIITLKNNSIKGVFVDEI